MDSVAIASIQIPAGRRRVSQDAVDALSDSIKDLGLLNPITVTQGGILLAGLHRVRACEALGWTEIPCYRVDPQMESTHWELAEIDENLIRNDLTVLERAEHEARRKVLYEKLHPEAPTGPGRPALNGCTVQSFTEDTARKTGVARSTVQRDIQIATRLTPETKDLLRDTETADSTTELLRLTRLPGERQQVVAEKLAAGDAKSVSDALRTLKQEEKAVQSAAYRECDVTEKVYQVILCDPPWEYNNTGVQGAVANQYDTLMQPELCGLLSTLRLRIADDAVLFLWATNPMLREALELLMAWGFAYKTNMVWVKTDLKKSGVGFYVRGRHELLFIATRGSFTPLVDPAPPVGSVLTAPVGEHSEKPDEQYDVIERLYPGCTRLELFARKKREGWDGWGNQYPGGKE